jgi:hypothetical protein
MLMACGSTSVAAHSDHIAIWPSSVMFAAATGPPCLRARYMLMASDSCSTSPSSSIEGMWPLGLTFRKAGERVLIGASGASAFGRR